MQGVPREPSSPHAIGNTIAAFLPFVSHTIRSLRAERGMAILDPTRQEGMTATDIERLAGKEGQGTRWPRGPGGRRGQ